MRRGNTNADGSKRKGRRNNTKRNKVPGSAAAAATTAATIGKAKTKKKPLKATVEELLQAAAAAEAALDVPGAYRLYARAIILLRNDNTTVDVVETNGDDDAATTTAGTARPPPSSQLDDEQQAQQRRRQEQEQQQTIMVQVLEKMGELQVSLGDPDQARAHFVEALQLLEASPQERSRTYYEMHSSLCLYIGQVSLGHQALEAYLRGVTGLEQCLQLVEGEAIGDNDDEDEPMDAACEDDPSRLMQDLRQKLSGAYCNLAELYLTDLCEEDAAEIECEQYLEKALHLKDSDGEPLVDALQTMASLRLSQQYPVDRQLEAVLFILRAYEKHRVGSEALAALVGLSSDDQRKAVDDDEHQVRELVEVDAANNLPEFEFRCQTAKLLLECAALLKEKREMAVTQTKPPAVAAPAAATAADDDSASDRALSNTYFRQEHQCITAAVSVLGSLLAQNDEIVEIWYLTGCAFAAKTPPMCDAARFYLERAKEMLTDIRKLHQQDVEFVLEEEREALQEELRLNSTQMEDVQAKLVELQTDGEIDAAVQDD